METIKDNGIFKIKENPIKTQSDGDKFMEGRNRFNVPDKTKRINVASSENWQNKPAKIKDGIVKEAYFDTQFKYQDFDEKQLVNRFLKWKRNHYIVYTAVNHEMKFANAQGKHFQFANDILRQRFDELFPWCVIIGDRQFFQNNELPKEYWNGRRYLYMVDKQIYDSVCTGDHKPRSIEHKAYPGIRIFRTYESLIELIEEKMSSQPILLIGKEPWARLRYFVDQIRLTYSECFDSAEAIGDDYVFPLNKFQSFLNFNTITKVEHSFRSFSIDDTEFEDVPNELPELFSDYIKFSYKSATIRKVEQKKQALLNATEHFTLMTIVKTK